MITQRYLFKRNHIFLTAVGFGVRRWFVFTQSQLIYYVFLPQSVAGWEDATWWYNQLLCDKYIQDLIQNLAASEQGRASQQQVCSTSVSLYALLCIPAHYCLLPAACTRSTGGSAASPLPLRWACSASPPPPAVLLEAECADLRSACGSMISVVSTVESVPRGTGTPAPSLYQRIRKVLTR